MKPEESKLVIETLYDGKLKRLVGFEFRKFAKQLARNLEELIRELPQPFQHRREEGNFEVDFEDSGDFKRKLYRFSLEKTEDIPISEEALFQVVGHLIGKKEGVYYVSGTSPGGKRRFQLVLQDRKPTSVRYVEDGRSRVGRLSFNPSKMERIIKERRRGFRC